MPHKIFVRKYASWVPNAAKTLRGGGLPIEDLVDRLSSDVLVERVSRYADSGQLHFWDLGVRASKQIEANSILIVICSYDVYVGRVLGKITDPSGELGDALGWARQFRQPWQNVLVLSDLHTKLGWVDIPLELSSDFCVFSGPEAEKVEHMLMENGLLPEGEDVQEVMSEGQPRHEMPSPPPDWVAPFVQRINNLRASARHSERDHESLVEDFFRCLGYEPGKDLIYRQGHIDMVILEGGTPLFVVEVKRSWSLTYLDQNALEQAYRYSHEAGARYVILTNGDYYALFDRSRGFKYSDHLVGELVLSAWDDQKDTAIVEMIRKRRYSESTY